MTTVKVESDQNVEIKSGDSVTLEVPGAATTGHLWELKADPGAVEVLDHKIVPDEKSFGGAGTERFTVKPLKEGDALITLQLRAPWESEPAESHSVHIFSGAD